MTRKCSHAWTATDDHYQCAECGDTCATCNVCSGPTDSSLLACHRCLDREAQVLTDIEAALDHWQPQPRSVVPAMRYDQDRRGGNVDHVPLDTSDGPWDVEAVLRDWAAMWRDLSGDEQNLGAADYLRGHLMWAAHHADDAAWKDYRAEMRQLRHRARRMAGLLPQRQAGPCVYCGGDVVRDWADEQWRPRADGLSDELRCTNCRTDWNSKPEWRYANLHTIRSLPGTHPTQLVTREHARTIFPDVPAATWRSWLHRDAARAEALLRWSEMVASGRIGPEPEPERMPVRSWDLRGQALYRLSDLTAHVEARADGTRRGPKAQERRAG